MGVTIHDIADKAGVSIATVSHIINKTRYVSPLLCERVEKIIIETGYNKKIADKESKMIIGKQSVIAFVVPTVGSTVYARLIADLGSIFEKKGRIMAVYVTYDDMKYESSVLQGLMTNKRIAGIILAPACDNSANYSKLIRSGIPFICLDRIFIDNCVTCITSENKKGIYSGTEHLILRGHTSIGILIEENAQQSMRERLDGYKAALIDHNIPFNENMVLNVDTKNRIENFDSIFHKFYEYKRPTGIIACGNKLTFMLLNAIRNTGLECPKDVSVVGFGDEDWCKFASPPLTLLRQDTRELARLSADALQKRMDGNIQSERIYVPMKLTVRKSTQLIGRGPFGEKAVSPNDIIISTEDRKKLRSCHFNVGISFHYSGTAWTRLHESGIRDTFDDYGISVVAVTDAHFDPALQVTQLDAINMQKPDAIIAIPADDEYTSAKFKKISRETKLVLISSVPQGLSISDYCTCVSVNESENGSIAATLMGEYYESRKDVKAGLIVHGAQFYGTSMRDKAAEQTIREQYKNIEIVEKTAFITFDRVYHVCCDLINRHSDIQTLYVSWDVPAIEVIRALKDLRREDITIFTCDLDRDIGKYLASGRMVKGLSTQRPYEQGVAVAKAVAKALLDNVGMKYIAVEPCSVKQEGLLASWKQIMHEEAPMEIERALEDRI